MLQPTGVSPPDLTTGLITSLLPWVAFALLALWNLRDRLKAGFRAQQDDRQREIDKSLAPTLTRANEAEQLAAIRAERIMELEKEKRELEEEIAQLQRQKRERADIEDKLEREVFRLQGDFDQMDRRVKQLEQGGGKS